MHNVIKGTLAVCIPMATIGFIARSGASPAPASSASDCTVYTEDVIPLHKDRTEALIQYTDNLGDAVTAAFVDSAKVDIISAKKQSADPQFSVRLMLNTMTAKAGTWSLTVKGQTAECVGKITVGAPGRTA